MAFDCNKLNNNKMKSATKRIPNRLRKFLHKSKTKVQKQNAKETETIFNSNKSQRLSELKEISNIMSHLNQELTLKINSHHTKKVQETSEKLKINSHHTKKVQETSEKVKINSHHTKKVQETSEKVVVSKSIMIPSLSIDNVNNRPSVDVQQKHSEKFVVSKSVIIPSLSIDNMNKRPSVDAQQKYSEKVDKSTYSNNSNSKNDSKDKSTYSNIMLASEGEIVEHKRECHSNDNGEIIDGTKIWTDSALESSVLFEIPKDNLKDDNRSSVTNAPSTMPEEHKNEDEENKNVVDVNRSHDQPTSESKGIKDAHPEKKTEKCRDASSNWSHSPVVSFQIPKHKPVNIDTLGLRKSTRLLNRKKIHAIDPSEEDNTKEPFTSKDDEDTNNNSTFHEDVVNHKLQRNMHVETMRRIRIGISNIIKHSTYLFRWIFMFCRTTKIIMSFMFKKVHTKRSDIDLLRLQCALATYFNLGLFKFLKYSVKEKYNSQRSCDTREIYESQTITTYEGVRDSSKSCTQEILCVNVFQIV